MEQPNLVLIPTPIGNLSDMTPRAREVLSSVNCVLAEDTRTTGNLLRHFEISTPLRAFHAHNEHKVVEGLVRQMETGTRFALCSDAGTPAISDPGFLLVRAAVAAGLEVSCLPGPTAFVPALAASGIPCDRFVFEGFLPHKKGRKTRIEAMLERLETSVLYESPHRIEKLLDAFIDGGAGERAISVSREISKLHEEHRRGTVREVRASFVESGPRGEFVVVLGGRDGSEKSASEKPAVEV